MHGQTDSVRVADPAQCARAGRIAAPAGRGAFCRTPHGCPAHIRTRCAAQVCAEEQRTAGTARGSTTATRAWAVSNVDIPWAGCTYCGTSCTYWFTYCGGGCIVRALLQGRGSTRTRARAHTHTHTHTHSLTHTHTQTQTQTRQPEQAPAARRRIDAHGAPRSGRFSQWSLPARGGTSVRRTTVQPGTRRAGVRAHTQTAGHRTTHT